MHSSAAQQKVCVAVVGAVVVVGLTRWVAVTESSTRQPQVQTE